MNQNDKNELYNKIKTQLEPFEQDRIKRIWKMVIIEIVLLIIFSIFAFCSYKISNAHPFVSVLLGIIDSIILGIIIVIPSSTDKTFKETIKENCKGVIEKAFNLTFLNGEIFNIQQLKNSNLFANFNKLENDDVYQGLYKDVEYKVQETELIYEGRTAKGQKTSTTQFKGLVVGFKFNKHINTQTIIAPQNDSKIMNSINYKPLIIFLVVSTIFSLILTLGFLAYVAYVSFLYLKMGNTGAEIHNFFTPYQILSLVFSPADLVILGIIIWLSIVAYKKFKKMRKTKLEDVDFNKEYKVRTDDEVEARYLITTSFITRFMALQKVFHTKKIKCSFLDDEVIFAIETNKDMFELGSLYHSLKNDNHSFDSKNKDIEECIAQIIAIQNLIDHFKLDEKTGL